MMNMNKILNLLPGKYEAVQTSRLDDFKEDLNTAVEFWIS